MSLEMVAEANWNEDNSTPSMLARLGKTLGWILAVLLTSGLLLAGWYVWQHTPYSSDSDLAYNLGLAGGLLMLSLFIYPLRKRMGNARYLGPLRLWFKFHMVAGVLGPLLVLFHSTFQVHSFNAAVALGSMLLVVASGLVGRLLYRRIHRGLYGRRTTYRELQQSLELQLAELRACDDLPEEIKAQIDRFALLVATRPTGRWHRAWHFVSLGFRRRAATRRERRALKRLGRTATNPQQIVADLSDLLVKIDSTMRVAQRAAQFATFERLFSYWHAVHIPFLFMLVVTVVIHVLAVHAY